MAAEAKQPPSAATASYPPWVLLRERVQVALGSSSNDDASRASSATSTGHPIAVSLGLAAPPAVSSVRVHVPHRFNGYGTVLTAHGDSVLISIDLVSQGDRKDKSLDYFVYCAGAASGKPPRPPKLSLLPPCGWNPRHLAHYIGLLRRGEDEFVVALLSLTAVSADAVVDDDDAMSDDATVSDDDAAASDDAMVDDDDDAVSDDAMVSDDDAAVSDDTETWRRVPELQVLRHGRWSVERPPTIQGVGEHAVPVHDLCSWTASKVLSVGDRHLCWVDMNQGLLFCNVFDESPVLRYVELPEEEMEEMEPPYGKARSSRSVCVTGGGDMVKLVGVFPRCCCGGAGYTHCERSRHAYTINTWTLRMDTMAWVRDGMVDATELWALDAYQGLPRVPLLFPVMSIDDPHTVWVYVSEWLHDKDCEDGTEWLLLVDTRRKALVSIYRYYSDHSNMIDREFLPSRISCYLDANPCSTIQGSYSRGGHMDLIPSVPIVVVDEPQENDAGSNPTSSSLKSSPEPSMQASVIFAGLQEIPSYGLDRDDMLKAYNILSMDNGRCLRSLLEIPKNMRKDWLLMEIKSRS